MAEKITFILIAFVLFSASLQAQENPFLTKQKSGASVSPAEVKYPGIIQKTLNGITHLQRELNERLSSLSRQVNDDKSLSAFFLLLGIALFYGFIHALGPGHGKVIMISYAMSNPMKVKEGILLGALVALVHSLSAVVLVSLIYFILKSSYSAYSGDPKKVLTLISYGLLGGMGLFLTFKTIFTDFLKLGKKDRGHITDKEFTFNKKEHKFRNLIFPALIIGLIPCEGAILILIFSIAINAYPLGILLALVMSLGMALTISVLGIMTIYSRQGASQLIQKKNGYGHIIHSVTQLMGSIIIMLFGTLLFFSSMA